MRRDYIKWYSPSLDREMELLAYGDRGFPFVVFPATGGSFHEYEDRGMIHALAPRIEEGGVQIICVDSVDGSSWYHRGIPPSERLKRQNSFDHYLVAELAPFIHQRTSWDRFGSTGCSIGGYHAVNFALRHPDLVAYAVSLSGAFDIPKRLLQGFYNQDAYFHSPLDYLPNLSDNWFLERYRSNYYALVIGNGDPLFDQNVKMAHELSRQQIPHIMDVWQGFGHDWPWWQQMAVKFIR